MGLSEKSGSLFFVLKYVERIAKNRAGGAKLEKFCYYDQKLDNLDIKNGIFRLKEVYNSLYKYF